MLRLCPRFTHARQRAFLAGRLLQSVLENALPVFSPNRFSFFRPTVTFRLAFLGLFHTKRPKRKEREGRFFCEKFPTAIEMIVITVSLSSVVTADVNVGCFFFTPRLFARCGVRQAFP